LSAVLTRGEERLDCIIANLSTTGAKLIVPTGQEMPSSEFELALQDPDGTRRAVVMWRLVDLVGFRFVDAEARTTREA
jgi:hypothetical protein